MTATYAPTRAERATLRLGPRGGLQYLPGGPRDLPQGDDLTRRLVTFLLGHLEGDLTADDLRQCLETLLPPPDEAWRPY
jgi:hypothetical protein